jgi:phosphoglycolate phosphatase
VSAARLVLFDLDGTLVDSAAMILAAQAEAFEALNLPMPPREVALSIVGLSLKEAFSVLAEHEDQVEPLVAAFSSAFFNLRQAGSVPEPLFPGAAEVIARLSLRDDLVLGIATGKSRRGVKAMLEKHGWARVFASVQTADDAPSKPHPAMILQACSQTGMTPERTLMIGDSSYDMAMARAAGARAIGVSWGFQPVLALQAAGAEAIIPHFDALDAEIERMLAA